MTFIALAVAVAQAVTGDTIQDIPHDLLMAASPYGVDVTPDGTAWIDMAPTGQADDYAVRASDFLNRALPTPTIWVRGYHRRNRKAAYRTSMYRLRFICAEANYQVLHATLYRADGTILFDSDTPYARGEAVIPMSQASAWQRFVCRLT